MEEEYGVDKEAVVQDLKEYNNDLIMLRTAVSHIDGDLKMKVETARILLNDVEEQIEDSLSKQNRQTEKNR